MQFWSITDPGCTRPQNQDSCQTEKLDRNTVLCVVCDGMGGAKSGNVASSLAVDVFVQEVKRTWVSGMDPDKADQMLKNAVKLANFTVYDQAQQFEEFSGMGTTLVAALITGKFATIVNVGDSRAYCITESDVSQMTTDHSLVQMMIARGELTPEQARSYPGKNLITRAIGTEGVVECDIFHRRMESGECVLLCTDGLHGLVEQNELADLCRTAVEQGSAHCLAERANQLGGSDNITAVLLYGI